MKNPLDDLSESYFIFILRAQRYFLSETVIGPANIQIFKDAFLYFEEDFKNKNNDKLLVIRGGAAPFEYFTTLEDYKPPFEILKHVFPDLDIWESFNEKSDNFILFP